MDAPHQDSDGFLSDAAPPPVGDVHEDESSGANVGRDVHWKLSRSRRAAAAAAAADDNDGDSGAGVSAWSAEQVFFYCSNLLVNSTVAVECGQFLSPSILKAIDVCVSGLLRRSFIISISIIIIINILLQIIDFCIYTRCESHVRLRLGAGVTGAAGGRVRAARDEPQVELASRSFGQLDRSARHRRSSQLSEPLLRPWSLPALRMRLPARFWRSRLLRHGWYFLLLLLLSVQFIIGCYNVQIGRPKWTGSLIRIAFVMFP